MRAVWVIFLNLLPVCFAGDRIPVRYIGGRVCIPCEVAVGEQRMPAHLLVDLGTLHPLILDQEALSSFEIQKEDRLAVILSPSTRLGNLPYRTADLSSLRTFTKEYAGPLMEIPVLGVMGLPFWNMVISFVPERTGSPCRGFKLSPDSG
jgi:hypothetical protein